MKRDEKVSVRRCGVQGFDEQQNLLWMQQLDLGSVYFSYRNSREFYIIKSNISEVQTVNEK